MTPREFRQEQNLEFDHFQELTSTGINSNYVNIELFAHEYHKAKLKLLGLFNVVGSKPTAFEKNNLPLKVRYAFCEAIEMYHNIQAYEMGLVDKTDFINHTIAIKDKYK